MPTLTTQRFSVTSVTGVRAEHGVGLVEEEEGPVAPAGRGQPGERGHVAVHGEDRVGDDHGRWPGPGQQRLEVVGVGVAVDGDLGPCQPAAVDDRGVVELVGEDPAAQSPEHREGPEVGGESGGEGDGGLAPLPVGQGLLEVAVDRP